jgi:hypothetical protein
MANIVAQGEENRRTPGTFYTREFAALDEAQGAARGRRAKYPLQPKEEYIHET